MSAAVAEQQGTAAVPWTEAIAKAEGKFISMASQHQLVTWQQEANFAGQIIRGSTALQKCAPRSLFDAIINVAAIGLTLSPAHKLAYLVPRNNVATLSPSYVGLIKIATDSGVCAYVRADVIREHDTFVYRGPAAKAEISIANPFDEDARGPVVGAYAEARLASGDILTEIMSLQDLEAVENVSMAKSGPWKAFRGEMQKKTVLRRLCKTIPRSQGSDRLQKAIHIMDEAEGLTVEARQSDTALPVRHDVAMLDAFTAAVDAGDGLAVYAALHRVDLAAAQSMNSAWYSALPRGEKQKRADDMKALKADGERMIEETADAVKLAARQGDEVALSEAVEGMDDYLDLVEPRLDGEALEFLQASLREAA